MPSFNIAHIREQSEDMIIVPLDSNFENQTPVQQAAFMADLQRRARTAGLAGTVVLIWETGSRTKFIGPQPWHSFLKGLSMLQVQQSLNKTLSW